MAGKARKFAQLSPQKSRPSPAKYVRLTEVDDAEERRERAASKLAKTQQRTQNILNEYATGTSSPASRRLSGFNPDGTVSTMPRMPILANFEEWMKLATDNKINAGNSWNFALIDYFHEMSLLKDGDNINFQKASVTLDGCVKIYTNRVDSVATETGKLLSGLSSGKQTADASEEQAEGEDQGEDGEADEGEDGAPRKIKKKQKASGGSTLVKDFSAIQAKKLDMEFFVDPLFKKTSADFDEGGAKGLLLNHLCVDRNGRIIFDASDANNEVEADEELNEGTDEIDLDALGQRFFPELFGSSVTLSETFEELHLCPSLKGFTTDSAIIDIPLLASLAGESAQTDMDDGDNSPADYGGYEGGFDDGDAGVSGIVDVYDTNEDAEFGQANQDYAENLAHNMPEARMQLQPSSETVVTHGPPTDQHRMYAQFDDLFSKNWAGPSHWKIAKLQAQTGPTAGAVVVKKPRKEKEVASIDFLTGEGQVDEDIIFAAGGATTMLPKTQWSSKTRNLLPEDKHFNSESLLSLFMKPKAKLSARQTMQPAAQGEFVDMDEKFWAQSGQAPDQPQTFDANFFQDGEDAGVGMADFGDDDDHGGGNEAYSDAREDFGPTPEPFLQDDGATQASQATDFGSQLQALGKRSKPDYVNFARTAKKVDVHVLKTNIWSKLDLLGAGETEKEQPAALQDSERQSSTETDVPGERKFTEIVRSLSSVYAPKQMSEISTSFCFICLLHLANEKGLEIVGEKGMRELTVRRDETVQQVEPV